MPGRWIALSILAVALALGSAAQASERKAAGASADAGVAQDFSAAKYAKKQTDTYQRTKKYR